MNLQSYSTRRTDIETRRTASFMQQLVSMRNPDGIEPLFCIHPSGGDIGIYRKLATRLKPTRAIFGIQSRLVCGARTEYSSLEEMAHQYTQIIEMQQPKGDIKLLGFSLGGFVATLIARDLHRSGRDVSFLGLIDSNPGWIVVSENSRTLSEQSYQQLCTRLAQVFFKFQEIGVMRKKPSETVHRDVSIIVDACLLDDPARSSTEIMALTTKLGYVPDRQVDANALNKFTNTFLAHSKLLRDYRPPQIHCPLSLWWPSETESQNIEGSEIWSQHAHSTVTESVIKGSHYSIMRGASVRKLATELESEIERSVSQLFGEMAK